MVRCLLLGSQSRSLVGNGALVGAVLVREGKVIAEAIHEGFRMPHAERKLLEGFMGTIEPQDVLYVNLEPCCHHGKTPPCTDIIIQRGVKNVAYGMIDPDPRVAGKGIEALRKAGVNVYGPIERSCCERVNRGFLSVRTKGRPWITVKMAKNRAGFISKADGSPLKITSDEQDAWSHQWLRGTHDAILVGVRTIISDNPHLNTRYIQKEKLSHEEGMNGEMNDENKSIHPYRIILDPQCRIPETANVVCDALRSRTIIITTPESLDRENSMVTALVEGGLTVMAVPREGPLFAWKALWHVLITPRGDFHGLTSVLVEGGQRTWDAFRSAGVVDEEVALTAPTAA